MALTVNSVTIEKTDDGGQGIDVLIDIDFDSSYPTGGELLDVVNDDSTLKGQAWKWTGVQAVAALTSGRTALLNSAGTKLIMLDNAGAEIANATDLSAMTDIVFRLRGV